jgi:hypothetical protein
MRTLRANAWALMAGAKLALAESGRARRLQRASLGLQRLALMHEARKFIASIARESGCAEIFFGGKFRRDLALRLSLRRPNS